MSDTAKAIIAAAAVIAVAIYLAGEPRYMAVPSGGDLRGVYILDRYAGTARFCVSTECFPTRPGQEQQNSN
jgi:hypothetical protein